MRINSRALVSFFFAVALAGLGAVLFHGQEAMAESSFFSSRGCTDCHSTPTAATCAGCHHHSGTLTATKNKTTTYAPGETVTITLTASGARSGWIGARLYDQSGAEIARSTGNQSGMGGSTTFPAALSAPAPAAAGTYTWRMAYFGNEDGGGTGDVHSELFVNVSITVAAAVDATAPVVGAFTLPATATTLTVPVSSLTATDNVAVTGYLVTTSATAPLASAAGWTATAPASVTAPAAGSVTFFAWAKDAAGNVSASRSAAVNITLSDASAPVVSAFTLPANGTSLTVPVNSFTATDNVGVTGYIVTLSATPPASGAAGWTATAPASVIATTSGSITFFAWAKDAAGNVSAAGSSATVSISIETTPPTLTISTLANGAVTNNATLNVTGTASDASGIAGVTVNGTAVTVTGGAFSTALPLVSGANTITTIATDNVGNQTTDTRTINLDQAGPLLNVNSPADNSMIKQSFVDVTGTVSENSTVTVNGAGAAMNGLNFSANVNLVAGLNTIDITATDLGGNISTLKRSVTSDPVAPSLAVTVPSQDITSTTASNTISGTVSDALTAVTVTITADGKSYTPVVAGGSFTQAITLSASNTYAVIVTATDEAGNQNSVTRNIIFTQSSIGDINGDNMTDIQDALMALKLSVNLMPMNNSYMAQGDVAPYVNGHSQPDGHIDISDALAILKMSVGLLPSTL